MKCFDLIIKADGNYLLENTTSTPLDQCAYVVGSLAETQALANPFFSLSLADGALIAGAILALWAVGYVFRVLIQFLKSQ